MNTELPSTSAGAGAPACRRQRDLPRAALRSSRAGIAVLVLVAAVAAGCSYLAGSRRGPEPATGALQERASVSRLMREAPPKRATDGMRKHVAVSPSRDAQSPRPARPVAALQARGRAGTGARVGEAGVQGLAGLPPVRPAGGVVAAAAAGASALSPPAALDHPSATTAMTATTAPANPSRVQPAPAPRAQRSSWWPVLAVIALALLVLFALRRRSERRRRSRSRATARAITWAGVSAPAATANEPKVDFAHAAWPLPRVSLAMDVDWLEVSPPAAVATTAMAMKHDSVRAVDSRQRAIGAAAVDPIALAPATLPLTTLTYRLDDHGAIEDGAAPATLLAVQAIAPEPERTEPEPESNPMATSAAPDLTLRLADAKQWLTANQPDRALASLAPLLANGEANGEAWTVAGWSWWRIGRDHPDRQRVAAAEAASAFNHALRVEPDRANLLSRMIARCHQMRARHEVGAARLDNLDAAIAVYDQHLPGRDNDDAVLLEWSAVLFERATASPHGERAQWLERSERLVEQRWGRTVEGAGEPVQWLWINLLLARAGLVELRQAELLHARAASLLRAGIARFDDSHRDAWLSRLIDAERAMAQRLKGAARITRLRAVQAGVETLLASSRSIAPLRAWIGLLGDWAASLHGTAAQEKLKEAEPMFTRIEALSPDDGAEARFARAYYLRLRSMHEFGASRWQTLEQAQSLLASIARGQMAEALLDLESAEVHLEQAGLAHGDPAPANPEHLRRAAVLAESAAQAPENETRALHCAVTAMVAMARSQRPDQFGIARMKALATRLLDLAPADAAALRTVASMQLVLGDARAASELCAAAWEAGDTRAALLPIWREADARWAQALGPSGRDPHWQRLHQGMRMANSTL